MISWRSRPPIKPHSARETIQFLDQPGETREIPRIGTLRISAAIDICRMIHRKDAFTSNYLRMWAARIEGRIASGQLAPCDTSKTCDDERLHELEFGLQMSAAVRDFLGARVAISPARITRITSHEVRDEDAAQSRAMDHTMQQVA